MQAPNPKKRRANIFDDKPWKTVETNIVLEENNFENGIFFLEELDGDYYDKLFKKVDKQPDQKESVEETKNIEKPNKKNKKLIEAPAPEKSKKDKGTKNKKKENKQETKKPDNEKQENKKQQKNEKKGEIINKNAEEEELEENSGSKFILSPKAQNPKKPQKNKFILAPEGKEEGESEVSDEGEEYVLEEDEDYSVAIPGVVEDNDYSDVELDENDKNEGSEEVPQLVEHKPQEEKKKKKKKENAAKKKEEKEETEEHNVYEHQKQAELYEAWPGIDERIIDSLQEKLKITAPTLCQQKVLPEALISRHDILLAAPTVLLFLSLNI